MMLFAERKEQPETIVRRKANGALEQWMEDWYWDGRSCLYSYDWGRTACDHIAKYLHRQLRALRSMTDEQYIEMRKRRCFREQELEPHEVDGALLSARAIEIHEARDRLKELESRLASVVHALPHVHGYAVDQDHFNLRSYRQWWVNWRFASYISLGERLAIYKEMRSIERSHAERRRKERAAERRAAKYPELVRQIRELKAQLAASSTP